MKNIKIEAKVKVVFSIDTVKAPPITARKANAILSRFIIYTAAKNGRANGQIFVRIYARPKRKPTNAITNPQRKKTCSTHVFSLLVQRERASGPRFIATKSEFGLTVFFPVLDILLTPPA
jgi:hypothetical protein